MIFFSRKRKKHYINETPEISFSSTEDDNKTLPATSPINISPPVFSHLKFLERTDMISSSVDLPVIGGWEFDSDNDASWSRIKQTEHFRKIGARRLDDSEETTTIFINNNVDFDDMDDIAWVHLSSSALLYKVEHDTKERTPSNALANLPDCEIYPIGNLEFQTRNSRLWNFPLQ